MIARRQWMRGAVLAPFSFVPFGENAGAAREAGPRRSHLLRAVAFLETVLSPAAIADLVATPEEKLVEYRRGVSSVLRAFWPGPWPEELLSELAAEGVHDDEVTPYLITTLARRHNGRALDVEEQLAPFRAQEIEQRKRKRERDEEEREKLGHVKKFLCLYPLLIEDKIYFPRDVARTPPENDGLLELLRKTLRGNPNVQALEVQGHAGVGERGGLRLSLARARDVAARLRGGDGTDAPRIETKIGTKITAIGFGTRFPSRIAEDASGIDRDRRVEFLILRNAS